MRRPWTEAEKMFTKLVVGGVVVAVIAVAAGCGTAGERAREAGIPATPMPNSRVLDMPQGFADLGFGCHGTTGVYMSGDSGYNGLDVSTVPNDPECS